jgi:hypothetical protein
MTGIATGSIGTEGHAVAKPLQAKKRALARLGSRLRQGSRPTAAFYVR